ncbi:hypothetical protein OHA21_22230 [Actinoplanes sp. NBC_00393]|uniref:hypothetical protein n=1 Tax=Actinoplanes sp. NBC_00393 TaxID=2975953 RepID=UPI002E1D2D1C
MRTPNRPAQWFLAFAVLEVAGLLLAGHGLLPFNGTATMAALLAYALAGSTSHRSRPEQLLLAGLSLLTAAVVVAESQAGGYYRPDDSALGAGHELAAIGLVTGAVAALAGSVLARVDRWSKRRLLPAAPFALLVGGITWEMLWQQPLVPWLTGPDLLDRATVLLAPATALILLGFAVNAGLVRRGPLRAAAVALLPVLVVGFGALTAAGGNDLVSGQPIEEPTETWSMTAGLDTSMAADLGASLSTTTQYEVDFALPQQPPTAHLVDTAHEDEPEAWKGYADWDRSGPALFIVVLLLGLAALAAGLQRGGPRTGITLYSYRIDR